MSNQKRVEVSPNGPLGPLGFNLAQHSLTTCSSVERIANKAFLLSDRVELFSVEACVEGIKGDSVGVVQLFQSGIALFHTPNPRQPL